MACVVRGGATFRGGILFWLTVLNLIVLSAMGAGAQPSSISVGSHASDVQAILEPYANTETFSGVVLVAKDGKPIFERSYGMANREWDIKNTLDTKFRLASVSKQFTAAAILQLAERGKLNIDDPIFNYYAASPANWKNVTLRHLMTHRSGLRDIKNVPAFDVIMLRDHTTEELIRVTREFPLEFEPGTKYSYNNSAYILLGYVIEKVSGQPYAEYLQQHIFTPLGMRNSGYDLSGPVISHRASGYQRKNGEWVNASYLNMSVPYSAGSLYSTVGDLLIWDQALYSNKFLTTASLAQQFTDHGDKYGLGWFVDNAFNRKRIWHDGDINGFKSIITRYPEEKLTVIILSNYAGAPVERMENAIAQALLLPPRGQ